MILLAHDTLALGMKLAGVEKSYTVTTKEELENILSSVPRDEFIIATRSIAELSSQIEDFPNTVVFPDSFEDLSKIDDLRKLTRSAIGSDIEL